jgi:GNAT superfamily N-acetyltransferase
VEIRNPDKTHLPAVYSLLERCFPGAWTGAEVEDRIFYDALYDPNHVWMAREQGRVLGLLVSVQDGPLAWLKLLAVDETARRKGLGRDLVSRAEFRLAGEGVREWRIAPTPPREFLPGVEPESSAAAFFEAEGFERSGYLETLWTPPRAAQVPYPSAVDREAAAAFARARSGPWWPWVEEQLSWRPARASFDPAAGLCLADPGLSLGPLWPSPSATPRSLAALVEAALAVAVSAPPRRAGALRLWHVDGSADLRPAAGLPAVSNLFNLYTKALS